MLPMRKLITLFIMLAIGLHLKAQHNLVVRVTDASENKPLEGAAVTFSDSLT